jgi:hypothetical protein
MIATRRYLKAVSGFQALCGNDHRPLHRKRQLKLRDLLWGKSEKRQPIPKPISGHGTQREELKDVGTKRSGNQFVVEIARYSASGQIGKQSLRFAG